MTTYPHILETIRGYAPDADTDALGSAYLLAAQAHQGQKRKSGEDYLSHPLAVASILADLRMDVDTIATALLHDALEDSPITHEEMARQVGPTITSLVDGVTKIGKLKYRSKAELQAENFRKMMLAMSRDLRVILVKLADRLHNMRTLEGHGKPEKRAKIARETMEVYAPIANRLGLTALKTELEDLSFRFMDPMAYDAITAYLEETQADREAYTAEVCEGLRAELARGAFEGEVSGRAKSRYSIYKKMVNQGLKVHEVQDLLAFRVIVADLSACYAVIGTIHAGYKPVPGRFKDYIARPKPNGYQSLHTTVIGPKKRRIEVQVRTREMHEVAERGIAAHWRYKEGHLALSPEDVIKISRIRELFESAKDAESASDFMESVKVAFYSDEVFVFTPADEVKRLPVGSTPLDFAYAIHSDVGDTCVGARVDGRMVPLDHKLRSGQTVEVMTRPDQRPRRDWLKFARTSRAVSKIRRYLRQEEQDSARKLGAELLTNELSRFDWSLSKVQREGRVEDWLHGRPYKDFEALLVEIGRGHVGVTDVARGILPEGVWISHQDEHRTSRIASLLSPLTGQSPPRKSRSPVLITGEDGVMVTYAGCCNPLPGERVVGFITRGRGISVHRQDCTQLDGLDPERLVPVEWDLSAKGKHSGALSIHCDNRTGLLASITKACDKLAVNIESAEAKGKDRDGRGLVKLQLAVKDLSELTRVIRAVERIDGVHHVERAPT